MALVIGIMALMVATAALVVGLLTHSELSALRERERQSPSRGDAATAPFTQGGHAAEAATTPSVTADVVPPPSEREAVPVTGQQMTHEQRVEQAVSQKEYANFMTYDGGEQEPIDRDTILADSGE